MDTIPQVAAAMQQVLTTTAYALGRSSGFVQRASKLDGASFTQAWIFAWMANPISTWEDVSQSAATIGVAISTQGLEQGCPAAAAALLEGVLAAAVQQVISADTVAIPLLARCTHVFVQDSSTIALPPSLVARWQGCGGSSAHGAAALKLQVQLDLRHETLHGLALQDGRAADQRTPLWQEPLVAGALYLADLGCFRLRRFAAIAAADAFWLTRYQQGTVLFPEDGQRRDTPWPCWRASSATRRTCRCRWGWASVWQCNCWRCGRPGRWRISVAAVCGRRRRKTASSPPS